MNAKKYLLIFIGLLSIPTWAQVPYSVNKGDTLLSIADKQLGITNKKDPRRYEFVKLTRALNPQIKNPNALEPGQVLNLPAQPTKSTTENVIPVPVPPAAPVKSEVTQEKLLTPAPTPVNQDDVVIVTKPTPEPAPAQETLPAPKTEVQSAEQSKLEHQDFIFVQPRIQTLTLETKNISTKAKAKMESESSYGFDLQYGNILNHHYHLLFQAGLTRTEFKDISVGTVNHRSETLKSFAVGVAYEATSNLHIDLMAMYADRTFLIPDVGTNYKLKAVMIPGAELNISWDFYTGSSNIFGISAIGEYIASAKQDNVEYKSALEPFGALYWKSKYGHDRLNYKITLTYKHGHQETDISEQTEDLGILGVGFYF